MLGDMLELGHETSRMHRDVGQFLAAQGLSRLIVCGTLGRDIAEGARLGGMAGSQIDEVADAAAAADHLLHHRAREAAGLAHSGGHDRAAGGGPAAFRPDREGGPGGATRRRSRE